MENDAGMHDDEVRAVLGSLQHTCGGTTYDVVLLPSKRDPLAVSHTLQLRFAATPINGSGKTLKFTIYAAPAKRRVASRSWGRSLTR